MKMITIHERRECGVPVIIRGETGVGKTALVNMLSLLWRQSLLHHWEMEKKHILQILRDFLQDSHPDYIQTIQNMTEGNEVAEEKLLPIMSLHDASSSSGTFHTKLRECLLKLADDPASALLFLPQRKKEQDAVREEENGREKLKEVFERVENEDTAEVYSYSKLLCS